MTQFDPKGGKPTASRQNESTGPIVTITGPSARATEIVEEFDAEQENGLAIFATHGAADASTTLFATAAVGADAEANPLMAHLLQTNPVLAAGVMLGVVGAVSLAYTRVSRACDFSTRWFAVGLALVGLAVATINVAVGVTHV